MNGSKAKNIIIVILVVINFGLLFSSKYTRQNYSLSAEAEKSIVKLLNRNGIELLTDIPKKFSPMPQLSLLYQQSDREELKSIFFGNEQEVRFSVELGDTILKKDNKTLAINGAKIDYTNKDNETNNGIEGLDKTAARKIADQFVKNQLGKGYLNYKYFSTTNDQSSYCISYYENYKDYKIYSNYIKIYVTDIGISSVKLFRYQPESYDSVTRQICSADEALLTFIYEVATPSGKTNMFIDKIELGYILDPTSQKTEKAAAIPCYIISVKDSNKVYYINAYTNTLIEG